MSAAFRGIGALSDDVPIASMLGSEWRSRMWKD